MRKINIFLYIEKMFFFSISIKRIEQQAVEINLQKSKGACQSCSKVKIEMKDIKKKYKLMKFKAYFQIMRHRLLFFYK